jgi:hypothetical protein
MEWFLPREKAYTAYTDSLIIDPSWLKDKKTLFSQYYLLKDQLKKYRQIEKKVAGIASCFLMALKR